MNPLIKLATTPVTSGEPLSCIKRKESTMRRIMLACLVVVGAWAGADSALADGDTTVVVQANARTTDTGIFIRVGTAAVVTASGSWDVCGGGCPSGPDGATNGSLGFCPGATTDPAGELLGSLDGGAIFFRIGSGPTQVSNPGELLLGPNDCARYDDNNGSVTATILLIPTDRDACKKGGWQNLQRLNGTPFNNQGSCIRYVNTGK